jgi:TolB-like protein/Tfp pilus assembly protein PilF
VVTGPQRRVFISYASPDAAEAQKVCAALEAAGFLCWIAPRNVVPGTLYADSIVRGIDESMILVLVLSVHAVASAHVGKELERATAKRHPIIALRMDKAPLTAGFEYFLNESQWIEVGSGGSDAAIGQLVGAVGQHLAAGTVPTNQAAPPIFAKGKASARGHLWIIAGALIVIALAAAYFLAEKPWLRGRGASISDKSIAVLPFTDMSEKRDQEYFSDGMTEELIDMLTKIPELRVPARTSSFYFKGKQANIAEIARALGVANVLEGSVRKSGNTIRITAQLVRADNGYHVWSETFDRQLGDVFKIQDDIAQSVVGALKVSLLGAQLPRASTTTNSEAYTLYLQAQSFHLNASSAADEQTAIDYLRQSLKLDPEFAPAWVALASVLATDFSAFGTLRHEEIRAQAHEAANQARRLDPALPLGHIAMGRVLYEVDWNWPAAEAEIKQAMALEPGNAEARRLAGYIATTRGHYDEAIDLLDGAASRDPLQPWGYIAIGYATLRSGKLAETEANYRKALSLDPAGGKFHYLMGSVLLVRGKLAAALEEMEKETDPGYRQVGLALAFDALGRRGDADRELAIAEQKFGNEKAYWIALVYAARKDVDRAFVWLDRAFGMYDGGLLWILGDPFLNNLKADARYEAFLRKMKLPQ